MRMIDISKPENLALLFLGVDGIITEDDSSDFDSEFKEEDR